VTARKEGRMNSVDGQSKLLPDAAVSSAGSFPPLLILRAPLAMMPARS